MCHAPRGHSAGEAEGLLEASRGGNRDAKIVPDGPTPSGSDRCDGRASPGIGPRLLHEAPREGRTADHRKFKPRVACDCPPVNGIMRAGYLTSDPISTNVYCAEPSFNPDGSLLSDDFCLDWVVLGH